MTARTTSAAFIGTRFFGLPFWALLSALSMILYKEFHVPAWQLTLLVALKPASSLLAVYWSSFNRRNLVSNLVLTNILRFVPFLLFYWVSSPLFVILAFGFYMTLSRGSMPAWMEIFKRHLPDESRSKIFALGNAIEYLGTALLPLALGVILDIDGSAWRWLFPLTALIGIFSTLFLVRIPHAWTKEVIEENR
ncbi:MAG: MFS transporter, partial [Chlamydiae bacterium]|nr:MFS transporter [Chlamydiota bacterium]